MERSLIIRNFRNIGVGDSQKEKILLNRSLKKGELGDLVILIGANNSGKSNVLDALMTYGMNQIKERDITDLSYTESDRKPSLELVVKDSEYIYSRKISLNGQTDVVYPSNNNYDINQLISNIDELKSALANFRPYFRNMSSSHYKEVCDSIDKLISNEIVDVSTLDNLLKTLAYNKSLNQRIKDFCINNNNFKLSEYLLLLLKDKSEEQFLEVFKEKYKINFIPKIEKYVDQSISNISLKTPFSSLSNNSLFISIFELLEIDVKEIHNTYQIFQTQNNRGVLDFFQNDVNQKMIKVNHNFNKLFFMDNEKYEFKFNFDPDMIYLSIFRSGKPLYLDYQSVGFKWFFNLYFNLLCKHSFNAGDIIIMDEPATNLHVQGKIELRRFLKDFASKNDITIVLATHDPFLIDLDYLDEIRVISNENNRCLIGNNFYAIDHDDPDTLIRVKEALTVHNHVLVDPDKKIIFVEGITDYNYLVAMAHKLKYENFIFLPINGVGKVGKKDQQMSISKKLLKIRRSNSIVLVDSDAAGNAFKKINSKDSDLFVATLADIDEKFVEIESVFSKNDQLLYGILSCEGEIIKTSSFAVLKSLIESKSFEEETLSNFKKIFEFLENN